MKHLSYNRDSESQFEISRSYKEQSGSSFNLDGERFEKQKYIGAGSFGAVRFFTNNRGKKVAVRAPIRIINPLLSQAYRYAYFSQQNFGVDESVRLIYWDDLNQSFEINLHGDYRLGQLPNDDTVSDWRIIMPALNGTSLKKLLEHYKFDTSAQFILLSNAAYNIQDLHEKNILHGDIHAGNFLIYVENNENIMKIIDFDFSYYLHERPTMMNAPVSLECHIPPERRRYGGSNIRVADVRQDIYSFAYMLKKFTRVYNITTPELNTYIEAGLNPDINYRPASIEEFYDALEAAEEKTYIQLQYCYKLIQINCHYLAQLVFTAEENLNNILTKLIKLHKALFEAQTSLFKSDSLTNLLHNKSDDLEKLDAIIEYVQQYPISRISKALEILETYKLDIQSASAIEATYLIAFQRSNIFANTNVYGEKLYSYQSAKHIAEEQPLTARKIRKLIKLNSQSRLSTLAQALDFDESIILAETTDKLQI